MTTIKSFKAFKSQVTNLVGGIKTVRENMQELLVASVVQINKGNTDWARYLVQELTDQDVANAVNVAAITAWYGLVGVTFNDDNGAYTVSKDDELFTSENFTRAKKTFWWTLERQQSDFKVKMADANQLALTIAKMEKAGLKLDMAEFLKAVTNAMPEARLKADKWASTKADKLTEWKKENGIEEQTEAKAA